MTRIFAALIAATLIASAPALGGERTVKLSVENMTCATCPYIVRQSLAGVPGVRQVDVSFELKTATVTFDDETADIAALRAATTGNGFPSQLVETPGG
ncbi:cation transporter [Pseudohoeflea coraliihabitans]|uniref:Cation transporter n=1 Tax=Pseudohoeflea coraliihabitans TaxID=2860393 RepID=A0ABS6WM36_9HYPH|nr:cation transporter [Pseudohoeflea sp. DP4N28-3]MBW3097026.1 cation transporter [Pseudohoeflea sp. DP4N28-3]